MIMCVMGWNVREVLCWIGASAEGGSMLNLSMVSTLLGAAIGLRFGVLALVPVMALELGVVAVNAIAIGESVGRLAIVVSLVATSAQLGYIGGSVLGFLC